MTEHVPPKFHDGGGYEKMMGRWSQVAGRLVLDFLRPPEDLHWLDVGCGNGAFTELLIRDAKARKTTGIDPSEGLLDTASARLEGLDVELLQADADDLPFADNAFDGAVMALVINFLPDPPRAVAEMARVVRPGGPIVSYIWDIEGGGFTMEPIRLALQAFGVSAPITGPEKARRDYTDNLWGVLELQNISSERIDVPLRYVSFEDFWESNTGIPNSVANTVAALTDDDVLALKRELRSMLPAEADGSITYNAAVNVPSGHVPV